MYTIVACRMTHASGEMPSSSFKITTHTHTHTQERRATKDEAYEIPQATTRQMQHTAMTGRGSNKVKGIKQKCRAFTHVKLWHAPQNGYYLLLAHSVLLAPSEMQQNRVQQQRECAPKKVHKISIYGFVCSNVASGKAKATHSFDASNIATCNKKMP